jgi:hypothetical protein
VATMHLPLPTLAALAALCCAAGCSSQQAYGTGQAWQRNECQKIADAQRRSRCLESANQSYEDYQREAEAAARSK